MLKSQKIRSLAGSAHGAQLKLCPFYVSKSQNLSRRFVRDWTPVEVKYMILAVAGRRIDARDAKQPYFPLQNVDRIREAVYCSKARR